MHYLSWLRVVVRYLDFQTCRRCRRFHLFHRFHPFTVLLSTNHPRLQEESRKHHGLISTIVLQRQRTIQQPILPFWTTSSQWNNIGIRKKKTTAVAVAVVAAMLNIGLASTGLVFREVSREAVSHADALLVRRDAGE
jgi:hypothetical protein